MDLLIAGTNPLATDMTAAYIIGFRPEEISTFVWAWKAGMTPFPSFAQKNVLLCTEKCAFLVEFYHLFPFF